MIGRESCSSVTEPAFLLDSNICIYVLADASGPAAIRLGECAPGAAATSSIVYAEVLRGVASSRDDQAKVDALFGVLRIMPFDAAAATAYAVIPFKRGTFDRLIGAHALSLGLTLVTSNFRDYADIPGLKIENWALP